MKSTYVVFCVPMERTVEGEPLDNIEGPSPFCNRKEYDGVDEQSLLFKVRSHSCSTPEGKKSGCDWTPYL